MESLIKLLIASRLGSLMQFRQDIFTEGKHEFDSGCNRFSIVNLKQKFIILGDTKWVARAVKSEA